MINVSAGHWSSQLVEEGLGKAGGPLPMTHLCPLSYGGGLARIVDSRGFIHSWMVAHELKPAYLIFDEVLSLSTGANIDFSFFVFVNIAFNRHYINPIKLLKSLHIFYKNIGLPHMVFPR